MRHTHPLTSLLNTSTLRLIKGWHLLFVAAVVLLASVGFAAFLYGHTAAFVTPSLGTAQSFGVLGASTVTNTGPTNVNGDLGVWPGTAVTGFPPGIVSGGVIHTNDAVAQQAQSDVTIAYNSLAGMPCNTNLTGQDLGGLTLAPGVYCFNTSAQLTGTLRLDGQGNPDAVFIFQVGSTLVTASNAAVLTINGAQNCDAFWQVGSSATLGTGTSFIGSILALASVTMNTNATLSGRAMARTGAVTMDSNAITRTACAPTLAKAFTPPTIFVNGISTLTITLSNPNTIAANLIAPFTDTLPAGVTIAAPPNAANTCGGVVTATAGSNTVTLTGGMIPAGNGLIPGSCTITVNVTGALPGGYLNTLPIGALQTSNGNNLTPATATLTIICPVIDTTITAPAAVCALSTGNAASVPNAGVGATYDWTITNGTITGGQGTPNITFSAGTTSPVMLNVTVTTSPGCSASNSRQITINPNPTAATGPPQALCESVPGPTVFTLNGTVANGTPLWSVLGTTGTALATLVTPNSATTAVNVIGNGTVTLRLTVTSNTTPICGTATDDVVLTINANSAAAAGPDQMLCQTVPGPTVFTVTGTATGGTPQWSVNATTGTATAIIGSPNSATTGVNVTGTGTVTLRLTVTSNATPSCSVVTDDVVLTVNPSPVTTITVATPVCGLSTSNTASVPDAGAGATYLWTITNGTITGGQGTRNITWTAGAVSPVTLNVTVTTLPGCSANGSAQVTVNPNPIAAAIAPQTLCQTLPGPTVFTLNGTVANGTPQWSVLTSTGTAAATIVTPNNATTVVNVTGSGTVTLRLTVTSNAIPACGTATSDVVLTVNALPVSTITALATVCALTPGNTAAVPDAGAGATYLWTITGGTITAGQGTRSITWTAGNTGNVTLAVTVTTAAGCSTSSSTIVTLDSTCTVDVCIVKTASALVAIENSQFTYTLSVINLGPGTATGVTVTDTLQAGITLVSATPSQGTCSGTTTLICNLGNLANQATATIKLVVTFPMKSAGSVLCNTATITSNQGEIAPANNTSTVCVPVEKVPPGPGPNLPPTSQVSDQKAGSVLVFPYYTSDTTNPNRANTRICLTNVENQWSACVHLFFVDGATCSVADATICLSPNQTACFMMSDFDPGTSGYLVAVLVDCMTGCPLNINTLIGDEFIKLASGHTANVGAEAIAGLPGTKALCDVNSSTAELKFDGVMYNQLPRVLALDNLGSRLDGNDTVLILNRIGGNLATGAATIGAIFGLLYNDAEQGFSFSFMAGCQLRSSLTDNFPRLVPRLTTIIPAGRSGWLKLWGASDIGLFGVALNFNPNAATNPGAFNGGHNLHKLTLTPNASLTIPIFPPAC
jgi:uncharacterized repeat protein (TIGR01451 family)